MKFLIVFCLLLVAVSCKKEKVIYDEYHYDYVIVGMGAGGSVMARRLTEESCNRVLVIEQGEYEECEVCDDTIAFPTEVLYGDNDPRQFSTPQLINRYIHDMRYSGAGGTTRMYGALSVPSSQQLFDQNYPEGWQYEDLLPYIIKSEDHYCYYFNESVTGISEDNCTAYHGKGGPMQINPTHWSTVGNITKAMIDGCVAEGIPYGSDYTEGNRTEGVYKTQFFRKYCQRNDSDTEPSRQNAWNSYLKPGVRARPNLFLSFGARVNKILFFEPLIPGNSSAYGVEVTKDGETYEVHAYKEVIICAGAIFTPKLLQLSGVGDATLLDSLNITVVHNNTAVGADVYNHMAIAVTYELKEPDGVDPEFDTHDTLLLFLKSPEAAEEDGPNIEIEVLSGVYLDQIDSSATGLPQPEIPYLLELITGQPIPYMAFIITLTDSTVTGSIKIRDNNPNTYPTIDFGWSPTTFNTETDEFKSLLWAYEKLSNLTSPSNPWGNASIVREAFPANYFNGTGTSLLCSASARECELYYYMLYNMHHVYHMTGSCKMGEVVDTAGKVIGVNNVRICDNSIHPVPPDGNPTKTTYALCEKMADMILNGN